MLVQAFLASCSQWLFITCIKGRQSRNGDLRPLKSVHWKTWGPALVLFLQSENGTETGKQVILHQISWSKPYTGKHLINENVLMKSTKQILCSIEFLDIRYHVRSSRFHDTNIPTAEIQFLVTDPDPRYLCGFSVRLYVAGSLNSRWSKLTCRNMDLKTLLQK